MPVSAQIITALRIRADALDAEVQRRIGAAVNDTRDHHPEHSISLHRLLAEEFRALADQAEAR
jgi:hypothetical protein